MQARFRLNGKSRRGAALLLIISVFSFLTVFGGVLIMYVQERLIMSQLEMDRIKAFGLAEAGMSQAIYELKFQKDDANDGIGIVKKQEFGEGYFYVQHVASTQEIVSTGVVNGVRRSVQIKYALN